MRFVPTLSLVAWLLALWAGPVKAYFDSVRPGARALGLGEAYLSLAEDPWGIAWNPAGLARLERWEGVLEHETPFGFGDLRQEFAGLGLPLWRGGLGVAWSHLRLEGGLSENLFLVGYGVNLLTTTQNEFLAIGGTLKLAQVRADDFGSDAAVTGDLGVLLRPFSVISMAYAARNIGRPEIEVVAGGGGTPLVQEHEYGIAVRWQQDWTFSYSRRRDSWGQWRGYWGMEYAMSPAFALRGGLLGSRVTGGLSWRSGSLSVDGGIQVHETLGTTYRVSLSIHPGKKGTHGTP